VPLTESDQTIGNSEPVNVLQMVEIWSPFIVLTPFLAVWLLLLREVLTDEV
jgi:hypothetical protein